MANIPWTLLADDLIGGYLVEEPIGSDGTAEIFTVLHVQLEIRRILKVIRPEFYQHNETARIYFLQEMQRNTGLQHKKLRNICEVGWDEEKDLLYYVTSLPEGRKLSERLAAGKALPEERALKIVRELGEILRKFETSGGIVHRNINPENIFLENDELVLLNEPGIALPEANRDAEKTLRDPHYSAPEILNEPQNADLRSDIFSLGAVWYAMITGQQDRENCNPPELDKYGLKLSLQAKELLLRMLSPDPAKRPASPTELLTDLDRLPDGLTLENQKLQELTLQTIDQTVSDRIRSLAADMQKQRRKEEIIWKSGITVLAVIVAFSFLLTLFAGCRLRSEKKQNEQTAAEIRELDGELKQLQEQEQELQKACHASGSMKVKK